jgi:TetR/AcrR family transcriptional regulator of autoinduction and epiphytic fitness
MTTPAPRLTDLKREAIAQAAIDEFRDNGFEVTSMDRIAARAGVSKRTVYNHFPSKEALFTEIMRRLWARSAYADEDPYCPERSLAAQLLELLETKMATLSDQNFIDLARIAIGATVHSPDRAKVWVDRLNEREETFSLWIRAAQKHGRLKPVDPAFAATQLHSLIKAFAFWPQVTLNEPILPPQKQRSVIQSALEMFLNWYAV